MSGFQFLHRLKSFPVGGGPQSDYSVCPRPLRRVFNFSGFQDRLKSFPVGGGWVVVHKVIIVSVRVLYVGFSISLVFGFRVFRLVFGFRVFRFSGFQVLGFQVFQTGRDARFFGRDRMGRGARQQLYFYHFSQLISQSL